MLVLCVDVGVVGLVGGVSVCWLLMWLLLVVVVVMTYMAAAPQLLCLH